MRPGRRIKSALLLNHGRLQPPPLRASGRLGIDAAAAERGIARMIVGIDLGTTNSAVAIWRDGAPHLVPNALGELLTPSAVWISRDGTTLVGAPALDRMATDPANTATSFKRHMGNDRKLPLARKDWRAEDLSALVLRSLCDDVEAYTGSRPTKAVITVPAYFNDRQRKEIGRAHV